MESIYDYVAEFDCIAYADCVHRVIYRVMSSQVVNYLIADGRRGMQSVLARRLLGA